MELRCTQQLTAFRSACSFQRHSARTDTLGGSAPKPSWGGEGGPRGGGGGRWGGGQQPWIFNGVVACSLFEREGIGEEMRWPAFLPRRRECPPSFSFPFPALPQAHRRRGELAFPFPLPSPPSLPPAALFLFGTRPLNPPTLQERASIRKIGGAGTPKRRTCAQPRRRLCAAAVSL